MLVSGCGVGAMLNQEPCELDVTPFGCPVQWSPPILVLGCCVDTVLDQEPCELDVTL